ncbi:hypothetical protein BGZ58_010852 [Dissophora ornata]|nr:hypothetical protein BGZ58_010852 [Dissophora ornata]
MGTSSIMASAILAVLKTLKGESYTAADLINMTLDVEQMMNTGGGWQDQVGGVLPGFKVSTCGVGLPIQLDPKSLSLSDTFVQDFDSRLLLIYTGKTRLAKDLLQTVLMNWAGQDQTVVDAMDRLVEDATQSEHALREGNIATVGSILSRYFTEKRFLSETTLDRPPIVAKLLTHLESYIEGASLAGAGGGGFLVALLKPGYQRETVVTSVREAMMVHHHHHQDQDDIDLMWTWQATVDTTGLVVQIGGTSPSIDHQ